MPKTAINVVWFKKDLRLYDHAPLKYAIEQGLPLLLLYVFEPSLRKAPDWDIRHWQFVQASLNALNQSLNQRNTQITIWHGEVAQVFEYLLKHYQVQTVFSHQETGNKISYDRDKQIATFFAEKKINWQEFQSNGVIRGLKNRKNWDKAWKNYMLAPLENPNWEKFIPCILDKTPPKFLPEYALQKPINQYPKDYQPAGEKWAWTYLQNFFKERAKGYTKNLSKPETSRFHSSRLSVYLTWGNLSTRQVYQYYQTAKETATPKLQRELKNFRSRLQWRCHFIQKFEMEDRMEFEPLNRAYNQLDQPLNPAFIKAWQEGKTGYPLIDACMRCVQKTGFLNFRMRAMLVSFLTHLLWQPWHAGVHFLARQFLDYEIGIHYPQFQMQAGIVGIHTIRIYNPIKQAKEQDKEGRFIKKWLPELQHIPATLVHEPWKLTLFEQQFYQCIIGKDYPAPIVKAEEAAKKAGEILWEMRKQEAVIQENNRIIAKHVKPTTKTLS